MTAIVGIHLNGVSWLGGDSLGSSDMSRIVVSQPKVFHSPDTSKIIFGCTHSFRGIDILRYTSLIDEVDLMKDIFDHQFLVQKFVPKLQQAFSENGFLTATDNGQFIGSNFLIGTPHSIYEVQSDFSIIEANHAGRYNSVGSGSYSCMGFLAGFDFLLGLEDADLNIDPQEILLAALHSAEINTPSVGGPFHVVNTENVDTIIYDRRFVFNGNDESEVENEES